MKLRSLIIIYFLFINVGLIRGQYWEMYDYEIPTEEHAFILVQFITPEIGWVIGRSGKIYYTDNAGQSWVDKSLEGNNTINAVQFLDENRGYLSTESGLFKTGDGGDNWELIHTAITDGKVKFVDETFGWAAQDGKVYRTTDGGIHWTALREIPSLALYPVNKDTCFVIDSWPVYVYRTYDGGASWQQERALWGQGCSLQFFDNCHGIIKGYADMAWTYDCGKSFTDPFSIPIGWMEMVNENEGWLVNGISEIHHTTNGWQTWETQFRRKLLSFHLYGISFSDNMNGWVTGDKELILKTVNGGQSWKVNRVQGPDLNAVHFIDFQNIWAAGKAGAIYFKGIGNLKWRIIESPVHSDLNSIFFTTPDQGWVVGDSSIALRTEDGGLSWQTIALPGGEVDLHAITFEGKTGVITGDNGTILISKDSGNSWSLSSSGTENDLYEAYIQTDQQFIAIGQSGTYIQSTDGGSNWQKVQQFDNTGDLKAISFSSQNHGWLISDDRIIYRTEDGGGHWDPIYTVDDEVNLHDILFKTDENGWIIGSHGIILRTDDGGQSWSRDDFNLEVDLKSISFVDEHSGYIVGHQGVFLKHAPFTTSTEEILPDPQIAIFPNPARNNLNIQVKDGGLINSLVLHNLFGQQVLKQENVNLSRTTLDGTNLPKGTYLLLLTVNGKKVSKKIVLL